MSIRVPRVTLNTDYGDEKSFGDLSLLALGYGLHQTWVYSTMFGNNTMFQAPNTLASSTSSITLNFLVSIIAYGIGLCFAARTDQKFLQFYISKRTLLGAALLACLGTFILLIPGVNETPVLPLLSGVLTGIGSALLILFWGTAFARRDGASIVLNTALAIPTGIGIYAVIIAAIPAPLSGILAALIPLLELAILWQKTPENYAKRNELPIFNPLPVNASKFFLRFGIPAAIFGIALGVLRKVSIQFILPAATNEARLILLIASGCAAALILVTLVALNGAGSWTRFFRPLIPFVAVSIFFLPFSDMGNAAVANLALLIGYLCFEALMWIFFGELSQRLRLSPVLVFGLGRGMLAMGILVGSILPNITLSVAHVVPFGENLLIVAILLLLVCAYATLPREREIESIVIPCPLVRNVSAAIETEALGATPLPCNARPATTTSSTNNSDSAQANPDNNAPAASDNAPAASDNAPAASDSIAFAAESAERVQSQIQSQNANETPGNPATTLSAASASFCEAALQTNLLDHPHGTNPQTASEEAHRAETSSAPAKEQPEKQSDNPQTSSLSGDTRSGSLAQQAMNRPAEVSQEERPRTGRFRKKCECVANTFLLSRRETEVLFFLAKGNNAAYIQEKLYISEGTAKTHIRHIYRKLDVHNQQELMRLVESIEIEA